MNEANSFFIDYSDKKIGLALQQYFFDHYKYDLAKMNKNSSKYLKYLYYATIGIDELVDSGWETFESTDWNNSDFYNAIGFFHARFLTEIKKRISNIDLYENKDSVENYIIENRVLLTDEIAEAIRHHKNKLQHVLPELIGLAEKNRIEFDNIKMEKWKNLEV